MDHKTAAAALLFCLLLAVEAQGHVQPTRIFCPVLVEGRAGEMFVEISAWRVAVGEDVVLTCVHTDGVDSTWGPPLALRHVPEPKGQLIAGLVALALLGRRR